MFQCHRCGLFASEPLCERCQAAITDPREHELAARGLNMCPECGAGFAPVNQEHRHSLRAAGYEAGAVSAAS